MKEVVSNCYLSQNKIELVQSSWALHKYASGQCVLNWCYMQYASMFTSVLFLALLHSKQGPSSRPVTENVFEYELGCDCNLIPGSMSRVASRKDFIMENHFMKKRDLYFTVRIIIRKKYLKKRITLLSKDFQIRCYNMWHYVPCW
jgi:hypothetical protein